jgi:hypothetical protein
VKLTLEERIRRSKFAKAKLAPNARANGAKGGRPSNLTRGFRADIVEKLQSMDEAELVLANRLLGTMIGMIRNPGSPRKKTRRPA